MVFLLGVNPTLRLDAPKVFLGICGIVTHKFFCISFAFLLKY